MTTSQRNFAISQMRAWLAAWSAEQLSLMAADAVLSETLRDAARLELEARAVSAVVMA